MKNPPHLGRIVRQDCIEALELTVTKANEKAGISAGMAIRLESLGWSEADHWMRDCRPPTTSPRRAIRRTRSRLSATSRIMPETEHQEKRCFRSDQRIGNG